MEHNCGGNLLHFLRQKRFFSDKKLGSVNIKSIFEMNHAFETFTNLKFILVNVLKGASLVGQRPLIGRAIIETKKRLRPLKAQR